MEKEKLYFICDVCNEECNIDLKTKEGFYITAQDEIMEWSDFEDKVPDLNEEVWNRSVDVPKKGELRKVKVKFPFSMSINQEFFVLFKPGIRNLFRWDKHKFEIVDSAIVKCRFVSIISKNDECAWIDVKIEESILLSDITHRIPARKNKGQFEKLFSHGKPEVDTYGDEWIIISKDIQGDLGNFGLIKKQKDSRYSLVLYAEWDFHNDLVYVGNIDITKYLQDLI